MPPPFPPPAGSRPFAATSHESTDAKGTSVTATALLAAHPGPAMHVALLAIVVVIGLIAFAVTRVRRRRESAEAEQLDPTPSVAPPDRELER